MNIVDRRDVMRRVAQAREGASEQIAVAAVYYMLGGSENWIVRNRGEFWWLDNRQNNTQVKFRELPSRFLAQWHGEVEWPEEPSPEVSALMSRAAVQP